MQNLDALIPGAVPPPPLIETLHVKMHWGEHSNVTPTGGSVILKPLLIIRYSRPLQPLRNDSFSQM